MTDLATILAIWLVISIPGSFVAFACLIVGSEADDEWMAPKEQEAAMGEQ
ncbi:hypothetical protein [Stappia sp. P2PMeth1]|nr:hypothetical protein [Stappia sp. P2PMeth1]